MDITKLIESRVESVLASAGLDTIIDNVIRKHLTGATDDAPKGVVIPPVKAKGGATKKAAKAKKAAAAKAAPKTTKAAPAAKAKPTKAASAKTPLKAKAKKKVSEMTPEEAEAHRKKAADYQRNYRAKKKNADAVEGAAAVSTPAPAPAAPTPTVTAHAAAHATPSNGPTMVPSISAPVLTPTTNGTKDSNAASSEI